MLGSHQKPLRDASRLVPGSRSAEAEGSGRRFSDSAALIFI